MMKRTKITIKEKSFEKLEISDLIEENIKDIATNNLLIEEDSNEDDYDDEDDDSDVETKRIYSSGYEKFCPACQSRPCMCSDPDSE